jgi:hypothetical protein
VHLPALEHPTTRRAFAGFTVPSGFVAWTLYVVGSTTCLPQDGVEKTHSCNKAVPSYAEACNRAVSLHRSLPAFGMGSWDVAIGTEGSPVLIEANLRYQEIIFLQLNNGPLFGRYKDEVLSMM